MNKYSKLKLTDTQELVLSNLKYAVKKCIEAGVYLIESPGYGCYVYNAKEVSCLPAPEDAAYDNGKEEIDITKLHEAFRFGLTNYDLLPHNETKCLVAFT